MAGLAVTVDLGGKAHGWGYPRYTWGMDTSGSAPWIDLNADCGEGLSAWPIDDGVAILDVVTSANVACGFHAGDPTVARTTCEAAAANGVSVGAHVSYDDLRGFGRRFVDVAPNQLTDQVVYQIGALQAVARAAGSRVRYVKPHGALYNTIVHHPDHAAAVVQALKDLGGDLPLLVLPGSEVERQAMDAGLSPVREAFADRAYNPDGTLVSRREPGAVLHDHAMITQRVVRMAIDGAVTAIDGSTIPIDAVSVCVHGDTPGALEIARGVAQGLEAAGVEMRSFT